MHLIELCFLLWKESTSLQKLHIDGADFYANYKGWKSFKGMSFEEISYSSWIFGIILSLNDGEWTSSAELFNQGHGSVLQ